MAERLQLDFRDEPISFDLGSSFNSNQSNIEEITDSELPDGVLLLYIKFTHIVLR